MICLVKKYKFSEYSNSAREIINLIRNKKNNYDIISKKLNCSKPMVADIIRRLIDINVVEKIGKPSPGNEVKFKLKPNCKCPYCNGVIK